MTTLSSRLKSSRKEAGLTQAQMAEALRVSVQAVSQWELGRNAPTIINIMAWAQKLSVSVQWLMNGEREDHIDLKEMKGAMSPLLTWKQLGELASGKRATVEYTPAMLQVTKWNSDLIVAIEVSDDIMAPEFVIGDIVFFDMRLMPEPGDSIVARIQETGELLFRRFSLVNRSGGMDHIGELSPLNPNYPKTYFDPDEKGSTHITIVGTLVEHRRLRPAFKRALRKKSTAA